ncbi:MAG: zinc-dependent metalloprotease [Bacteroidota bacterium]
MKKTTLLLFLSVSLMQVWAQDSQAQSMKEFTESMVAHAGYFPFYWDGNSGKIWVEVDKFDQEFLYVNSLAAGIGSNDIGLDRGQLGENRVVKFIRSGPKVMLVQMNYDFRAMSENEDEKISVEQAFAQSILGGFTVKLEENEKVLIDITDFLLRDAHHVIGRLQQSRQGNYRLDAKRSAIYLPRTKNFPQNTEFESILTFSGEPKGSYVREVVPSPDAITVRQHHSFVQLPDANYSPRVFDPRSGYNFTSYQDYASPIEAPLVKRFINRHRLEKKNPTARVSEAVEPIIYYVDRGAPEPIRSALVEGASWWNQAFEAAGYKDAFQVKILPEEADPMDVRYNLIQWVHRSTRGWSYGASVRDPRTGEIIKGHVSLGSLRVRQDFLIAQGLVQAYEKGTEPKPELLQMALARLRQLSAHEVGHTIGLAHNFAASVNDRASVMDYPHPYLQLKVNKVDFSESYDVGIGEWDKRAIIYGYQDFPDNKDEAEELEEILEKTIDMGLHFISDQDARPVGGAHPLAHLWDNGENASREMNRLLELRKHALSEFSENNIPEGRPLAELEEVLVPLYFAHRYQVEAVAKLIGGQAYTYAARGDGQTAVKMVAARDQEAAIKGMLRTLEPDVLALSDRILELIPPRPLGYRRGRENFKIQTDFTLDPIAAAEAAATHTLRYLLHPARASRLVEFHARESAMPGLDELLEDLLDQTWGAYSSSNDYKREIQRAVAKLALHHLMQLGVDKRASSQARAIAMMKVMELKDDLRSRLAKGGDTYTKAHMTFAIFQIDQFLDDPAEWAPPPSPRLPDGSPIGCGGYMNE